MKIYILGQDDYDGKNIYGVYSTKEKALEACPYFNCDESNIEELEVDPPNQGDKYEQFYHYNIFRDGKEEGCWISQKPSEFNPIGYGVVDSKYSSVYSGQGKTIEEAKLNAYKARDEAHPVWQISNTGMKSHHAHPSLICHWELLNKPKACYAVHEDYNVAKIAIMEYEKSGKLSPFLTVCDKSL